MPGRKTRRWPESRWIGQPFLDERDDRLGARRPVDRPVFQRTRHALCPRPGTIGQPSRKRATGSASSVADMTTRIKSGRTSRRTSRKQRQRQVAIQVALVKLVEDDGADGFEERVGQELPGEDALGQESQAGLRVRTACSKRTW